MHRAKCRRWTWACWPPLTVRRWTPRRWLLMANPGLSRVIADAIGQRWSTDGGEIDELAGQSVSDLEEFWKFAYPDTFDGELEPVAELLASNVSFG